MSLFVFTESVLRSNVSSGLSWFYLQDLRILCLLSAGAYPNNVYHKQLMCILRLGDGSQQTLNMHHDMGLTIPVANSWTLYTLIVRSSNNVLKQRQLHICYIRAIYTC